MTISPFSPTACTAPDSTSITRASTLRNSGSPATDINKAGKIVLFELWTSHQIYDHCWYTCPVAHTVPRHELACQLAIPAGHEHHRASRVDARMQYTNETC